MLVESRCKQSGLGSIERRNFNFFAFDASSAKPTEAPHAPEHGGAFRESLQHQLASNHDAG